MAVVKIIELVGSSKKSSDDAAQQALKQAQTSLRNIRAIDVVSTGLRGENLDEWRAHVRVAFLVEGTDIDVEALVEHARSYGVRLIGPGSMGIASSRPSIGLQASLVPVTLVVVDGTWCRRWRRGVTKTGSIHWRSRPRLLWLDTP